jgi:autotransporter-associated beta strand protein
LATASLFQARSDIAGNHTLTGNRTFSTTGPDVFTIGASSNYVFQLGSHTATFSGSGDFQVNSKITGTGRIVVNLSDPSRTVEFNTGNSYTGDTLVKSGRLLLDTPAGADNGVLGNLVIGGGPNLAVVTRHADHNNALIGDNSSITINQNGVLEFNRSSSWGGESLERWGALTLNGGSIVNASQSIFPTIGSAASLTLLADSVIDLGNWMSILIDDVSGSAWTPSAVLTIKNWSFLEPVYMGGIDDQRLSQIRFETAQGTYYAKEFGSGFVIPSVLVPEASPAVLLPLLGLAGLWHARKFLRKAPPAA